VPRPPSECEARCLQDSQRWPVRNSTACTPVSLACRYCRCSGGVRRDTTFASSLCRIDLAPRCHDAQSNRDERASPTRGKVSDGHSSKAARAPDVLWKTLPYVLRREHWSVTGLAGLVSRSNCGLMSMVDPLVFNIGSAPSCRHPAPCVREDVTSVVSELYQGAPVPFSKLRSSA